MMVKTWYHMRLPSGIVADIAIPESVDVKPLQDFLAMIQQALEMRKPPIQEAEGSPTSAYDGFRPQQQYTMPTIDAFKTDHQDQG